MEWWGALGFGVLGLFVLILLLGSLFYVPHYRSSQARVYFQQTPANTRLVSSAQCLQSPMRPACCLANEHVSSIHSVVKPALPPPSTQHLLPCPDGGAVALDILCPDEVWPDAGYASARGWGAGGSSSAPTVVILPGIGGGTVSATVRTMARQVYELGWRAAIVSYRGCAGTPLITPRTWSLGSTEDLEVCVRFIKNEWPSSPLVAVGFSMGSNILLKFLGTTNENPASDLHKSVLGAFSFGNGFYIKWGYEIIEDVKPLCGLYEKALLYNLKKPWRLAPRHVVEEADFDVEAALNAEHVSEFASSYFKPVHNLSREDECELESCIHHLSEIKVPVLCMSAADDPLLPVHADEMMRETCDKNLNIIWALHELGGHIGFDRHLTINARTQAYQNLMDLVVREMAPEMVRMRGEADTVIEAPSAARRATSSLESSLLAAHTKRRESSISMVQEVVLEESEERVRKLLTINVTREEFENGARPVAVPIEIVHSETSRRIIITV